MRSATAILAVSFALVLVPGASAVSFPTKCKSLNAEQVKATRITVTRETGCKQGRAALKHWILSGFNTRQSHLGYFCHWDTHGAHSRRGRCIAGKNGGVAFTITEKKLD